MSLAYLCHGLLQLLNLRISRKGAEGGGGGGGQRHKYADPKVDNADPQKHISRVILFRPAEIQLGSDGNRKSHSARVRSLRGRRKTNRINVLNKSGIYRAKLGVSEHIWTSLEILIRSNDVPNK